MEEHNLLETDDYEYNFDLSAMLEDDPFPLGPEGWMNAAPKDYSIASTSACGSDAESRSSAVSSPALSEGGTANLLYRFVNLKDHDLLRLSVKELNTLVKKLPKDTVDAIKKRRRTLKNRGYAYSCRQKRLEEKSKLETSKGMLEQNYATMELQLKKVTAERDEYKRRYENLFHLILAHRSARS